MYDSSVTSFWVIVKNSSPLPTVGRLLTDKRPTVGRQATDKWPIVGRQFTNSLWKCLLRLSTDCWPTVGRQSVDCWRSVGGLSVYISLSTIRNSWTGGWPFKWKLTSSTFLSYYALQSTACYVNEVATNVLTCGWLKSSEMMLAVVILNMNNLSRCIMHLSSV